VGKYVRLTEKLMNNSCKTKPLKQIGVLWLYIVSLKKTSDGENDSDDRPVPLE
jgi:hypothetical protein